LQEISDNDATAKSIAEEVNRKPDITEDEFLAQIEAQDKFFIEGMGFQKWLKMEKKAFKHLKEKKPEEYTKRINYFSRMKKWAKEHDLITSHNLGARTLVENQQKSPIDKSEF